MIMDILGFSKVDTTVTNQGDHAPTKEIAKEIAGITTEIKFLELDNPVEITISDEAKKQYREMAKQMTKQTGICSLEDMEIIRKGTPFNSFNIELALNASMKELAAAGEGKELKELNFQEKAENLLGAYAKLYDEISQGTKTFYAYDENGKPVKVAKEEVFAELDRYYEKKSEYMEQQEKRHRWSNEHDIKWAKQVAESLESAGKDATKFRNQLQDFELEQQRIKESDDDIEIEGFSKKMLDVINDFKEQYGTKDIHTILSEMGLFERLKLNI